LRKRVQPRDFNRFEKQGFTLLPLLPFFSKTLNINSGEFLESNAGSSFGTEKAWPRRRLGET
jgi:hypothetical protein